MNPFTWIQDTFIAYRSKRASTGTVRYMFPAILGTAVLLSASVIGSTDQSYVTLVADTQTVEKNELFSVEVNVFAHTPINAVDITVNFPAENVEVFSVDRGQSVLTIWTEDPIIKNNSVQLTGGTFKRGFIGEHQVAIVKFRALATGQYQVSANEISLIAGDGEGSVVEATDNSLDTITVFNFDENTSAEDMKIAIASGLTTDINNDGKVTLQDISAFMGVWSNRSQLLDFNNDGKMTFKDFSIILADFFLQ